jgi:hypothetical protein
MRHFHNRQRKNELLDSRPAGIAATQIPCCGKRGTDWPAGPCRRNGKAVQVAMENLRHSTAQVERKAEGRAVSRGLDYGSKKMSARVFWPGKRDWAGQFCLRFDRMLSRPALRPHSRFKS